MHLDQCEWAVHILFRVDVLPPGGGAWAFVLLGQLDSLGLSLLRLLHLLHLLRLLLSLLFSTCLCLGLLLLLQPLLLSLQVLLLLLGVMRVSTLHCLLMALHR